MPVELSPGDKSTNVYYIEALHTRLRSALSGLIQACSIPWRSMLLTRRKRERGWHLPAFSRTGEWVMAWDSDWNCGDGGDIPLFAAVCAKEIAIAVSCQAAVANWKPVQAVPESAFRGLRYVADCAVPARTAAGGSPPLHAAP